MNDIKGYLAEQVHGFDTSFEKFVTYNSTRTSLMYYGGITSIPSWDIMYYPRACTGIF
jgi:hypothetical protein